MSSVFAGGLAARAPGRGSLTRLLLACLLCARLAALDTPVVELSADPVNAEPGARVTLQVIYRWPTGWVARDSDPALAFADLTAAEYPPPTTQRTAVEERRAWTVVILAPSEPGPWALPRPAFTATGPDGPRQASAPLVVIQIGPDAAPVTTAAARPLVATLPGVAVGPPWWRAAAGGMALALVAGGLWWWLGRPPRPPPTPLAVFRRAAADGGVGKAGAADLSLALRRYLGAVHGFDGAGATAREAAERVRAALPEHEHATLAALLIDLDDRRWAAPDLPAAALDAARAAALAWVDAAEAHLAIARAAEPARRRA